MAAIILAAGQLVLALLAARLADVISPRVLAMQAGVAIVIGLLSLVHAALRRLAAEEAREHETLAERDHAIFGGEGEGELLVKTRNLRQFERFMAPVAAVVIGLGELVLGVWALRLAPSDPVTSQLLLAGVLLLVGAICLYLLGSYLAGQAFRGDAPVLRAIAGEAVGLAYLSGFSTLAVLLLYTDWGQVDALAARVLALVLLARGGEKVFNALLQIYRPRTAAGEALVYESRLNGLVAQPRSILRSIADSLSYQFGLQVSEAQARRAAWYLVPFLGLLALVLLVFSCVVIVNPGEQVIVERWGRPLDNGLREPGLHAKLPWPADRVFRFDVGSIRQLTLGMPMPQNELNTNLWLDSGGDTGELLLVTDRRANTDSGSFGLLAATVVVQWRISDVRAFAYRSLEPDDLLRRLARREVSRLFAGQELFGSLRGDRQRLNEALLAGMAAAVNQAGLGIDIVYVGVVNLQPPQPVVPAFQEVIAADEISAQHILTAESVAEIDLTAADRQAKQLQSEAKGYRANRIAMAEADRQSLLALLEFYKSNPEAFRQRAYLNTIPRALQKRRKVVIATEAEHEVINLDLKDKSGLDLMNLGE